MSTTGGDDRLTVDLDDGEAPWAQRCAGYIDRVLQGDFVQTEAARHDLERLRDILAEVAKR